MHYMEQTPGSGGGYQTLAGRIHQVVAWQPTTNMGMTNVSSEDILFIVMVLGISQ